MSCGTNIGKHEKILKFILITLFFVIIYYYYQEDLSTWRMRIPTIRQPLPTIRQPLPTLRQPLPILNKVPNKFCKDILSIQDPKAPSSFKNLDAAMEEIANIKRSGRGFMLYLYYYILSTFVPPLIEKSKPYKGTNGTNYTIHQESRLDRMKWKIPYLPCKLREYTGEDISTCARKKNQRGQKLRIAFMGDSRVRRTMEFLLELLKNYNLTIVTEQGSTITSDEFLGDKGNILWPKYKQKLRVKSSMLQNFLVTYKWAPFFRRGDSNLDETPRYKKYLENKVFLPLNVTSQERNGSIFLNETEYIINFKKRTLNKTLVGQMQSGRNNGAFDELQMLLRMPRKDLPNFVFIGSSAWELADHREHIIKNLDFWEIDGAKKIFRALEELGSRTTVVVALPQPFKDYLRFSVQPDFKTYARIQNNKNLQWYLNAQLQLFPKNVHRWDSFLPVAFSSVEDCSRIHIMGVDMDLLPKIHRFDTVNSYQCLDRMHTGFEAISVAVQMILNHICNADMDKHSEQSYCCES